jgi:hypothetical protein
MSEIARIVRSLRDSNDKVETVGTLDVTRSPLARMGPTMIEKRTMENSWHLGRPAPWAAAASYHD